MSAAQAVGSAQNLRIRAWNNRLYRHALESLAESLLSLSSSVDIGALPQGSSHAVYLEVPTGIRGASFASRVLKVLARHGFRAHIGIADERFCAWVAASTCDEGQHYRVVPRGGTAAFLAPLPLKLLPLERDVIEMLGQLGIATLGAFADLPAPSGGKRWGTADLHLHAGSNAEDKRHVFSLNRDIPIVETVELEHPIEKTEAITFLLRPLFDRACERLRGRQRSATDIKIRLECGISDDLSLAIHIAPASVSSRAWLDRVLPQLRKLALANQVTALEVMVTHEAEPEPAQIDLGLFDPVDLQSPYREHRRTRRGSRGKSYRHRHGDEPRGNNA